MSDATHSFWTLSTSTEPTAHSPLELVPDTAEGFTPERLGRLRKALEVLSDSPSLILERHPVDVSKVEGSGRVVAAGSPLLESLHKVVGRSSALTKVEQSSGATGVLYKMVLPKEIAGDMAKGLVRPMKAAGGGGAIRGGIIGKSGIVAQAKFVPVAAAGGAGAGAGAVTAGAAVVMAAPLVILVAATAASIHAEENRRRALSSLQDSLDKISRESLERERDALTGTMSAITKATAILADEGRLGVSLGLDSAVNTIDTAVSTAEHRLAGWEKRLRALDGSAQPSQLEESFPGIDDDGGEFVTRLRMAVFAIATKRRLSVLQAAEHTQLNPELAMPRFMREMASESEKQDELEDRLRDFLRGLANLAIELPSRKRDIAFRPRDVREILAWGPRLREIAQRQEIGSLTAPQDGVEVAVLIPEDGPARVLPPA